jgi:hypothetical protein
MVNEILPLSTANNWWRNASLNEIENIHGPRISEGHSIPRASRMPSEQCPSRTGVESLSSNEFYSRFATLNPTINKIRHTARNRKKRNFAIPAAAVAIPVKPKSAATSAITKNITAQRNMIIPPSLLNSPVAVILRALTVIPSDSRGIPKCYLKASAAGFLDWRSE